MLGHGGLVLGGGKQPGLGAVGVGHGLLGGEGFGRDEEERGLRVQELGRLGHVGAVYVGHEVDLEIAGVGLEGLGDHQRSEV